MKEETVQSASGEDPHPLVAPWGLGRAKAVLVISHGFNSHSGQYIWAAGQFAAAGYAVYAADLRGRGQVGRRALLVEKAGDYVGDVDLAVQLAKSREPRLKVFMLGHSAGGVVACTYALDHPSELAGLICESFAFQVPASGTGAECAAVRRREYRAAAWRAEAEERGLLSRSRDRRGAERGPADQERDAAGADGGGAVGGGQAAEEELPADDPAPLHHARLTRQGDACRAGSRFFADTAGSKDKTLKIYDGHFHDLLAGTRARRKRWRRISWRGWTRGFGGLFPPPPSSGCCPEGSRLDPVRGMSS